MPEVKPSHMQQCLIRKLSRIRTQKNLNDESNTGQMFSPRGTIGKRNMLGNYKIQTPQKFSKSSTQLANSVNTTKVFKNMQKEEQFSMSIYTSLRNNSNNFQSIRETHGESVQNCVIGGINNNNPFVSSISISEVNKVETARSSSIYEPASYSSQNKVRNIKFQVGKVLQTNQASSLSLTSQGGYSGLIQLTNPTPKFNLPHDQVSKAVTTVHS